VLSKSHISPGGLACRLRIEATYSICPSSSGPIAFGAGDPKQPQWVDAARAGRRAVKLAPDGARHGPPNPAPAHELTSPALDMRDGRRGPDWDRAGADKSDPGVIQVHLASNRELGSLAAVLACYDNPGLFADERR
jgi:hypothetical protein